MLGSKVGFKPTGPTAQNIQPLLPQLTEYLRPVAAAARLVVCGLLKALKVAFPGLHTRAA
jgi:hypothetical protein